MYWNRDQQQVLFFRWFARMGIYNFDIQLREPLKTHLGKVESWRWLTPSKNINTGSYFLKFSKWVKHMNAHGCDAYIRPHGETEQGVIFLDDLDIDKAVQVSKKYAACVVCTSKNNTQVWLATSRKLFLKERKAVQTIMKDLGYTDPGSVSGDHLGRLCGLKSQKRNCWVNLLTTTTGRKYSPPVPLPLSAPRGAACVSKLSQEAQSQSERDFGWAVGAFGAGRLLLEVERYLYLTAKQRGKRNPEMYARRTAINAYKAYQTSPASTL